MRVWLVMMLLTALSGCTGMLLGDGSRGETPPSEPRTEVQEATDNALTAAVRRQFNDDRLLSTSDLRIETYGRRVTLRGTVSSYAARDHAVRVASRVDGVEGVDNRIRVDSGN